MRKLLTSDTVKPFLVNLMPIHRQALIKEMQRLGLITVADVIRHLINEYLINKNK